MSTIHPMQVTGATDDHLRELERVVDIAGADTSIDQLEPSLQKAIAQVPVKRRAELLEMLREAVQG